MFADSKGEATTPISGPQTLDGGPRGTLAVGEWVFDPVTGEVSRGDTRTKLEPNTAEVLAYLARRTGRVVSRGELEQQVWSGRLVSHDAVTNAVSVPGSGCPGPAGDVTAHGRSAGMSAALRRPPDAGPANVASAAWISRSRIAPSGVRTPMPDARRACLGHRVRHRHFATVLLGLSLCTFPEGGDGAAPRSEARWLVGVLAHDRGPLSDEHEGGMSLNLERQFAPLDTPGWLGRTRAHIGITPNFNGDTSAAYGGLTSQYQLTRRLFVSPFLGVAVHNGPLHKDSTRCENESDCGFGSRLLLHLGADLGLTLAGGTLSVYYDHMSHYGTFAGENEGIDHLGVRYGFNW